MPEKLTLESQSEIINDIAGKIGVINDRLRMLEERAHQNRDKLRVVDEMIITKFRESREDIKRLNIEVDELRSGLNDTVKSLQRMVKELSGAARLNDVKVIEKVLDFFDPARFLTEKDVIRIIKEGSV